MSPRISIRLLPRQSDRRLLELVGHGDERAFETVVQRYRPALVRYCRRLGLGEPAAEDVVQHSFTKAWLVLSSGAQVNELRPWLYRIAHNNALNARRGAREAGAPLTALSDAHTAREPAAAGSIESSMQAREALGHVAALPEMQRDAVVLTAIQGHSHEEAAVALGISDGAVRGLLYRARSTLRSAAAAIAPSWLLQRLPGFAPAATVAGDAPAAGGGLGLGMAATKLGALAAGAGLLAAGVAGVPARHARASAHATHGRAAVAQAPDAGRSEATSPPAGNAAGARRDVSRAHGRGADPARGLRGSRELAGARRRGRTEPGPRPLRLGVALPVAPTLDSGRRQGSVRGSDGQTSGAQLGSSHDGRSGDGSSSQEDGGSNDGGGSSGGGSGATLEGARQDGSGSGDSGSGGSGSGDGGAQTGESTSGDGGSAGSLATFGSSSTGEPSTDAGSGPSGSGTSG